MTLYRSIGVKFTREGVHRYPAAATDPRLADVAFLAHPHRHIFHFEVDIDVRHNERDIEFIQFKRYVEGLYNTGSLDAGSKSCETLAEDLLRAVNLRYPGRAIEVSVSEDGENYARISWLPPTGGI
jgi:hypothetical protein